MFLQVAILQTDLDARKEAHTHLEEENRNNAEINHNLQMTLNELNKKIIVSICFDYKDYKCCCSMR